VQRPDRQAGRARAIGGVGKLARFVAVDLDEGVKLTVEALDERQMGVDDFPAGTLRAAQRLALLGEREVGDIDFCPLRNTRSNPAVPLRRLDAPPPAFFGDDADVQGTCQRSEGRNENPHSDQRRVCRHRTRCAAPDEPLRAGQRLTR